MAAFARENPGWQAGASETSHIHGPEYKFGTPEAQSQCALDWALHHAGKGRAVHPVNPRNKTPFTSHSFKDATTDPAQIRAWWNNRPEAMIAMATGEASGIAVLDLDYKTDPATGKVLKDGSATLQELMTRNGWTLPDTVEVRTPRGGRHLWFRHESGFTCSENEKLGIDVRANGGYAILPGSIRADGAAYAYTNPDGLFGIAEAPEWLAHFFRMKQFLEATQEVHRQLPPKTAERFVTDDADGPNPEDVEAALNEYWDYDGYSDWQMAAMALHTVPGGYDIWIAWARRSEKFDEAENQKKWQHSKPTGGITARSILHRAPREWLSARAKAHWKSSGTSVGELLDNMARREQQRRENSRIGAEDPIQTVPSYLSLEEALARFAFATDGSRVIDLTCPGRDLALQDFRNSFAASKVTVTEEGRDGKTAERDVPTASLWMASPKRHTVFGRTFRPGAEVFTTDPRGNPCVNSWRAFERAAPSPDFDTHTAAFLEHVDFLFGAEAASFLDWLAHIEQKPGVLPHTAWLHVSTSTGTGRNALASALTRVWRGHVAASFDLARCLASGFNGELAGRLLAIVDEIREGGRGGDWAHSETLKRLITEEQRLINPKYGRQSVEFNACRFLLLSNHVSAIPLDGTDRRFEVVIYEGAPKPETYYARLYGFMSNPAFAGDLATLLARRDLSGFNPGRHAKASVAKGRVVDVSRSESALYAKAIADHWPSDVIPNAVLAAIVDPGAGGTLSAAVRRAATDVGMAPRDKPVWTGGKTQRVYIIRNRERWSMSDPAGIAAEAERGMPQSGIAETDWRQHVDRLAARAADP